MTQRSKRRDKEIERLYELIDDMDVAMMTTRRPDGRLVSRPMATQPPEDGVDLWFVTDAESQKIDELEEDPHVNLGYYDPKSSEWVSVSGTAHVSTDRDRIRALWRPTWRAWLGAADEVRDGGPDDPRLALVFVDVDSVLYMEKDGPKPVVLFEVAKALATGEPARPGEVKRLDL